MESSAYWDLIALKLFLLNPRRGEGRVAFELFKEDGWEAGDNRVRYWVPEYEALQKLVGIHPLKYQDAGPLHAAICRLNKQRGKGK
jgi:hypothetical protein